MKRKTEAELINLAVTAHADSEDRQEKINVLLDLKEQNLKAKTFEQRKLKRANAIVQRLRRVRVCFELLDPKEKWETEMAWDAGIREHLDDYPLHHPIQAWVSRPWERFRELEKLINDLRKAGLKDHGLLPWSEICEEVYSLVELVLLQDQEIEFLARFRGLYELMRRHNPEQLFHLFVKSAVAEGPPRIEKQSAAKRNAGQRWERDNRRPHSPENSIEYQFGGAGEAAWRESSRQPYKPTCFDKVLCGASLNMRELLELFYPVGRERFPKDVLRSYRIRDGTKVVYRHPVVPIFMQAFLSERKPAKGKRGKGKAKRIWLSKPSDLDLRGRALRGLEAHIKGIANLLSELTDEEIDLVSSLFEHFRGYTAWRKEIADPILKVLRLYLSDSAN